MVERTDFWKLGSSEPNNDLRTIMVERDILNAGRTFAVNYAESLFC